MTILKSDPRSKSGRRLSDLPKINLKTSRTIESSIKRLNVWMLKEVKIEMRHCDYSLTLLKAIDLSNVSKSDLDTINLMLFGDIESTIELNK